MDDLELLSDDHSLLGSQVVHLVAMLRTLVEGDFETGPLHSEINRQAQLLSSQLVEHFEFEEITAFPRLEQRFPKLSSQLQALTAQHDEILEAFEAMRADLRLELSQLKKVDIVSKASFFESTFGQHADSESQLFAVMATRVSGFEEPR